MTVQAIRLQNFMGFEDTGWVELRSINLLFGRNSTGKSAILRALLLLRQSLDSQPEDGPLTFVAEDGLDFGGYRQMVRGQRTERKISFWFQCDFSTLKLVADRLKSYLLNLARQDFQEQITTLHTYRFRLIFSWDKNRAQIRFVGADLYDQNGNLILGATPSLDGQEQAWLFQSDFFDPNQDRLGLDQSKLQTATASEVNLWPYSRLVIDRGFLPRLDYPDSIFPEPPDDTPYEGNENIPRTTNTCVIFLREIRHSISTFLRTILYLGPLRAEPVRYYYVAGQPGNRLDAQGRHMVQNYLASQRDKANEERIAQLNRWLDDAGVGKHLIFRPVNRQKTLYEIVESNAAAGLHPNLREVGFGISQILPVLIEVMLATAGSTVLIEQPELHLHPAAQAELADLFLQAAALNGIRLIIETHSEHLLLRLRRRIAESTVKWISVENPLFAAQETVGIYYIQREHGKSELEEVIVSGLGKIISPSAFKGFFANDLEEIEMLAEASLAHGTKG
jgi:predicted ATPase